MWRVGRRQVASSHWSYSAAVVATSVTAFGWAGLVLLLRAVHLIWATVSFFGVRNSNSSVLPSFRTNRRSPIKPTSLIPAASVSPFGFAAIIARTIARNAF